MKTNGKKAIIATMAIAMAAGIAGSISGTVAWFQYNTRVTTEFTGTTAKCTEFLQVRTVKGALVKGKLANKAAVEAVVNPAPAAGDQYITEDFKLYTYNGATWDDGVDVKNGEIYREGNKAWQFTDNEAPADDEWTDVTATAYGDWKTNLSNSDIQAAAGVANDELKPVTLPGVAKDAPLGKLYGQPVCGYEYYEQDLPDHKYVWQEAEKSDYLGFSLQFRVLDIDGNSAAVDRAMLAQNLYLTDLTVAEHTSNTKRDMSAAVRLHIAGENNILAAYGDGSAETVTTTTHGALDLGGAAGNDTLRDVPNNYSFNAEATVLDYGHDKQTQVAYDVNHADAGVYPNNDGEGHLTGGQALGTTKANASGTAVKEYDYLTLGFTIFLEGWQTFLPYEVTASADEQDDALPEVGGREDGATFYDSTAHKIYTVESSAWNSGTDLVDGKYYTIDGSDYKWVASSSELVAAPAAGALWDADDFIGAKFNIGLSFGVTTLD